MPAERRRRHELVPGLPVEHEAEVGHGHVIPVDEVRGRGLDGVRGDADALRVEVGDDLMAVEVEVDPGRVLPPDPAAEDPHVEGPGGLEVVHREGQVEDGRKGGLEEGAGIDRRAYGPRCARRPLAFAADGPRHSGRSGSGGDPGRPAGLAGRPLDAGAGTAGVAGTARRQRLGRADLAAAWSHGRGLQPAVAAVVEEELAARSLPGGNQDKANLWANTVLAHGTDELKSRFLRPLMLGDVPMCLLYSEPGAGSDLASVQTRAERDGAEWIVNGQKVWTSGGRHAHYGLLIARTDWDVPKHRGITFFFLPMRQAGVEVRPLRQATGDARFNEVFLTDARVPDAHRLGEVDGGWWVLQTALMYERVAMGTTRRRQAARRGERGPGRALGGGGAGAGPLAGGAGPVARAQPATPSCARGSPASTACAR